MLKWLKQIITDHRAFNVLRYGHGDVELVSCSGEDGESWDCQLFQSEQIANSHDPAKAILKAREKWLCESSDK